MNAIRRIMYIVIAVLCIVALAVLPAQAEDLPLYDPGYPYYGYDVMREEGDYSDGVISVGYYVYAPTQEDAENYNSDYMFMYMPFDPERVCVYAGPDGNSFDITGDKIKTAIVPAGAVTFGAGAINLVNVDLSHARNLKYVSMMGCYNVKTLNIPYGVEGVSLNHLTGLTTLTLPSTVKFLDLWHLDSLTSLTIPEGVEYLAVRDCGKLKSLTIPRSVKAIFQHGFKGCSSLSSITIYGDPAPEFTSSTSPFKGTSVSTIYIKDASTENAKLWKSRTGKTVKSIGSAYTVRYEYGGEDQVIVSDAKSGAKLKRPVDPVLEGYTLSGWFTDEALTDPWDFSSDTMPSRDLTLYAGWEKACRVSFALDNGMRMLDEYVAPGSRVPEPFVPMKDSHQFTGWYRDSARTKPWNFEKDVVENDADMTLYAGWAYVVTGGLTINGSEAVLGEIASPQEDIAIPEMIVGKTVTGLGANCVPSGVKTIELSANIKTIDEKAFINAVDLTAITVSSGNTAYYAEDGVLYAADGTLVCYPQAKNGNRFNVPSETRAIGANAFYHVKELKLIAFGKDVQMDSKSIADPAGICLEGPLDAANLIAYADGHGFLYNEYVVRFISGGELVKEVICRAGEKIPVVADLAIDGYILKGWKEQSGDDVFWNFESDAMPLRAVTFEAVWDFTFEYLIQNESVTLTKYTGSDSRVYVPAEVEGIPVSAIASDAFAGFSGLTLVGDKGSVVQTFAVQNGFGFEALTYLLTFETNGGTAAAAQTLCATDIITPPSVTRYNYTLAGWYTDEALTEKFVSGTVMPTCGVTLYAAWKKADESAVFEYVMKDDGLAIVGYTGASTRVTIPAAIGGLPVVAIGDHAFEGTALTYVDMLYSAVTEIGESAFKDCKDLAQVWLPKTSLIIRKSAFEGCAVLSGNAMFYSCPVVTIEARAFAKTGIESISLPETLSRLDSTAFADCTGLTEILVHVLNPYYTSEAGIVYNDDKTKLIIYPCGKVDSNYETIATLKVIGSHAIENTRLGYLALGDSVEEIEDNAVCRNSRLSVVGFKSTKEKSVVVGDGAFKDCTALWVLNMNDSIASLGKSAFEGCTALSSVTIPDGLEVVPSRAFADCGLWSITLGPNTEFEDDAFDTDGLYYIYGKPGSPAEAWAEKIGVEFRFRMDDADETIRIYSDQEYIDLEIGESKKVEYYFYNESVKNKTINWSSSAPHVVSVDENGVLTGLFEGRAVITGTSASLDQMLVYVDVTRGAVAIEQLKVLPDSMVMSIGDSVALETIILPANAPQNTAVTWTTSNKNVATCTGGVVKAVGSGSAVITARAGSVSASCKVRIFESVLVLPESLETIPEEGFVNTAVVCVECSQGLQMIGNRAFADCKALERIRIYDKVQDIAADAFENSPNVVISAPVGSYAIEWAKANNISFIEE